jgi:hypothetical protein
VIEILRVVQLACYGLSESVACCESVFTHLPDGSHQFHVANLVLYVIQNRIDLGRLRSIGDLLPKCQLLIKQTMHFIRCWVTYFCFYRIIVCMANS